MIKLDSFYAEQLIYDGVVIAESGRCWVADNLDEFNSVKEAWKALAENDPSYEYVDEECPYYVALIIATVQSGHEVVFRRGFGFTLITEE